MQKSLTLWASVVPLAHWTQKERTGNGGVAASKNKQFQHDFMSYLCISKRMLLSVGIKKANPIQTIRKIYSHSKQKSLGMEIQDSFHIFVLSCSASLVSWHCPQTSFFASCMMAAAIPAIACRITMFRKRKAYLSWVLPLRTEHFTFLYDLRTIFPHVPLARSKLPAYISTNHQPRNGKTYYKLKLLRIHPRAGDGVIFPTGQNLTKITFLLNRRRLGKWMQGKQPIRSAIPKYSKALLILILQTLFHKSQFQLQ